MIALVTGGRDYDHAAACRHVDRVLDAIHRARGITLVVHGCCVNRDNEPIGADLLAHGWAILQQIPVVAHPARWIEHGRAAGPIRNGEMLKRWQPDIVVAMPGGRGTDDMFRRATAAGVEVIDERGQR